MASVTAALAALVLVALVVLALRPKAPADPYRFGTVERGDIASTVSRPANQSATILVISTLRNTAPAPLTMRPAAALARSGANACSTPPAPIASAVALPDHWSLTEDGQGVIAMVSNDRNGRLVGAVQVLDGEEIIVYKFRSMPVDAEDASGPIWARDDDPRATSIGRWLRKHDFDELPQFWNVLAGDMSIVGPRPERPFFVEQFKLAREDVATAFKMPLFKIGGELPRGVKPAELDLMY